jgi:prepilin-type N-terminal cleavage/methylation domain-containing protein
MNFKAFTQQNAGFTLIETMMALAIMVVAFAAILSVQSNGLNLSIKSKRMNVIGMLAKNKMVETELAMEGKKFDALQEEESGKFETPYEDYTWKRTIKEVKFPNLMAAQAEDQKDNQNGKDGTQTMIEEMLSKVVTKFLSKSIREIKISIEWNYKGKIQSYTIATYWVNLNNELDLSP